MNRNGLPQWLLVLLTLVGLVVLGPPVLGLLAGLIGLTIGLAAIALKLGVIAFLIFAVVSVFRALFGSSKPRGLPVRTPSSLESLDLERQARQDEEMRALDAELARMQAAQK